MSHCYKKLFIVLIFLLSFTYALDSDLQIYFLDVGQGDATLIIGENDKTILIDAGNNGKGNTVVIPFLDSLEITHLDYIIATHYHADHIGGIDEVILSGIETDTVFDRGDSYNTQTYFDYVDAIGSHRKTITTGKMINLGDNCYAQCIVVNGKICNGDSVYVTNDENAHCIGLLVEYNEFEAFIAGDLTGGGIGTPDVESAIASIVGNIEVYQVNHHGSTTSTNQIFVDSLRPEIAIVSVGENSYGHPTQIVLDRLQACEETQMIYQTESGNGGYTPKCNIVNGHISVFTNGLTYFNVNGSIYYLDEFHRDEPVGISDGYLINYPNPFSNSTTIEYAIKGKLKAEPIEIRIYNIEGQLVDTIEARYGTAGWDASSLPSGFYFYQLKTENYNEVKKMIFIK